jgi:shikimate dehydrogenase
VTLAEDESMKPERRMQISGTTRCYPILGHPIAQVRTVPAINAYFAGQGIDAVMVPMEIAPAEIDALLALMRSWSNCGGASVTVPHKQAAFRACDRVTERARLVGAVNIIRRAPDGSLAGDMTDGLAFVEALARSGIAVRGRTALVAGAAGGAGSAIAQALCEAGAARLCLVDPSAERLGPLAARLASDFPACAVAEGWPHDARIDVAVNASPVGMRPDDPLPIDLDRLPPHAAVCDVITKPVVTKLLAEAARRGHATQDGNAMADVQLPFQMRHLGLWTGEAAAREG